MTPEEHLQTLATDTTLINEAGDNIAGDTRVPNCDPWTVEELLVHLSQIWTFVARSTKNDAPIERAEVVRPAGSAGDWHRASSAELLDVLRSRNPTDKTWAFDLPEVTIAFWARRMCHEASIHRYDIQNAGGNPQPVEHDVAVDGIDEIFDYLVPRRKPTDFAGNGETLHLHATEAAGDSGGASGEWFITRTPAGIEVERKHAKGDVAARGSASDLLLLLWGRKDPGELDVIGDVAQLHEWQQKMNL